MKYLSNFWRFPNWLLIKCEIELDLSRLKECIISEISRAAAVAAYPATLATETNNATLQMSKR